MQFVDLKRQYREYRDEIMAEIQTVLDSAAFINGPAVRELEDQLADYCGVAHAIGCSSGTDALVLALMGLGIEREAEVIVPDFTFIATGETVSLMAAKPVFADVREDTYNLDPESVERRITDKTVGIMPVSLYGQPADIDEINRIAEKHGLWVIEDGAQSFGARYHDRLSCSMTTVGTTSFFPAKPLGAYGDAGAVFTNDDDLAATIRMVLNHGQRKRYDHAIVGMNARLDTIQAAVLKVKLRHFDEEIDARQQVADWYSHELSGSVMLPTVLDHNSSTWAQYTIRVPRRAAVQEALKSQGVPTAVHYPIPLHRQDAFRGVDPGVETPVTTRVSEEVMSLPMHPFLDHDDVRVIAESVKRAVGEAVGV